jgi:hypothetical protein
MLFMLSLEVVRSCGSLSVTFSFNIMPKGQSDSSLADDRGKSSRQLRQGSGSTGGGGGLGKVNSLWGWILNFGNILFFFPAFLYPSVSNVAFFVDILFHRLT